MTAFLGEDWDSDEVNAEIARTFTGHRVPIALTEDTVESDSRPGVYHTLKRRADGTWSCSCESYVYGDRDSCKHTQRKAEEEARGW